MLDISNLHLGNPAQIVILTFDMPAARYSIVQFNCTDIQLLLIFEVTDI